MDREETDISKRLATVNRPGRGILTCVFAKFSETRLKRFTWCLVALAFLAVCNCNEAYSADLSRIWPQWRGPMRDGQAAPSPTWPQKLDDGTLGKKGRGDLGPG